MNKTVQRVIRPIHQMGNHIFRHFMALIKHLTHLVVAFLSLFVWTPNPLYWRKPPHILIYIICRIVLFFQPVKLNLKVPINKTNVMLVANHTVGFGIDAIAMVSAIYLQTGIYPRGLADRMHFLIPGWCHVLWLFGIFPGSFDNCDELMARGDAIMVMRGRSDEKYTLMWKERAGFAKLAIKNVYDIVPVAVVGMGDMLKIIFSLPVDWIFRLAGEGDNVVRIPVVVPVSYQRQYVVAGPIISTKGCDWTQPWVVREKVRYAVLANVQTCLKMQKEDPKRYLLGF